GRHGGHPPGAGPLLRDADPGAAAGGPQFHRVSGIHEGAIPPWNSEVSGFGERGGERSKAPPTARLGSPHPFLNPRPLFCWVTAFSARSGPWGDGGSRRRFHEPAVLRRSP